MDKNLNLTKEWDKVFPQSAKVSHSKVTFRNRYGITLAADMYKLRTEFGGVVREAGEAFSPAIVAAYAYDLAKEFNQYYHDYPILRSDVAAEDRVFRLALAAEVARILARAMGLLGIDMPERM